MTIPLDNRTPLVATGAAAFPAAPPSSPAAAPAPLPPDAGLDAQEEWLLARIEDAATPWPAMAAILDCLAEAGEAARAVSAGDLLADAYLARRDEAGLLALLAWRVRRPPAQPMDAAACQALLTRLFENDRAAAALVAPAGFAQGIAAAEALRRFGVLRGLRPGVLCYEKTWGFGIVAELDDYRQQVVVDFERRKAHRMALAYAAETLDLLADDHLLARRHRDPAAYAAWLERDPAGAVKCALRSFGPLTAAQLQERMLAASLPPASWKRFWDAARKVLKDDPLVDVPPRRSDPLRLRERALAYDDAWAARFRGERDFDRILEQAEAVKAAVPPAAMSAALRDALADRLAFTEAGAEGHHWGQAAQAFLLAHELGLGWRGPDPADLVRRLLADTVFLETLRQLPARRLRAYLAFLEARAGDALPALGLRVLPDMAATALGAALDHLLEGGRASQAMATLKTLLGTGRATAEIVAWLCRRPEIAAAHGLADPGRLALEALAVLDGQEAAGERLKARHALRAMFEQPDWLRTVLAAQDAGERRVFVRRFRLSSAWTEVDRNAILARLLKLDPTLADALQEERAPALAPAARLTSRRSYRERQAQLDRLIREEIPRNSREIAVARGYGDLRENFEYKAAKDQQGMLLRRRGELETQLAAVAATEFAGAPTDAAGPGTRVTLRRADGSAAAYHILGEWDSDEALGIIASQSRLAQALAGRRPGERVTIPGPDGGELATLETVAPLPEDIRAWICGPEPAVEPRNP